MTTQQGNYNYTYDNIYQLTQVVKPGPIQKTYNFDPVGNRTTVVNGGTQTYTSNNLNQYTNVIASGSEAIYSYALNGNLTQKTQGTQSTQYTYDYENRLKTVIASPSGEAILFKYDPFGRRISKEVNGVIQTKYIYDQDNIILDLDANNQIIAKYVYGPSIDEPLLMIKGANKYYYSKDGLGSVVNLTDTNGNMVESYTYDEYGNVSVPSQIGNRYLYTGREYDPEINLYYYRARYYDPSIGRFLTTDPVGYYGGINLYGYVDSIGKPATLSTNLYVYTDNNPVNFVDPWGLSKEKPWWQKVQLYLSLVGAEMEKGYMTNMQDVFGVIGVGAGAYANVGLIPKSIGYSNESFIQGGRSAYMWANQYGSGIKAYSAAKLGLRGTALSITSAIMVGWTIGDTVNAYYWGYLDYKEKSK